MAAPNIATSTIALANLQALGWNRLVHAFAFCLPPLQETHVNLDTAFGATDVVLQVPGAGKRLYVWSDDLERNNAAAMNHLAIFRGSDASNLWGNKSPSYAAAACSGGPFLRQYLLPENIGLSVFNPDAANAFAVILSLKWCVVKA